MVSGFVTSPCDQLRICSGLASWILMASKSAMGPVSSKGLERNIFCVSLVSCVGRCSDWAAVQEILCDDLRCIALPVVLGRLLFRLSCHLSGGPRSVRSDLLGSWCVSRLPRWLAVAASSGRPV